MKYLRIISVFVVLISCAGHVSAQSVNPEETRFLQEMDQYFEKGEEFAQIALPVIANYYYGQAVVGVKSLDEAITAIYWEYKVKADKEEEQAEVDDLKDDVDFWGMEGLGSFLDFTYALKDATEQLEDKSMEKADSLGMIEFNFSKDIWDIIQGESIVSPYPEFFNGLVADYEGRAKDAGTHYARALSNPYMTTVYDFSYLADLSMDELKAISSRLKDRVVEYGVNFTGKSTTPGDTSRNWDPRWHIEQAQKCLKEKNPSFMLAELHCRNALMAYPFDISMYIAGAEIAIMAKDIKQTAYYINNGLLLDPGNATLSSLVDRINASK